MPNTQSFVTFYHAILSKLSKVNYLRFENGHLQAPGYKFWTTFTKLLSLTPSPLHPSSPPTWHAAALVNANFPHHSQESAACCGANL
jgi:hypothetical protein